MGSKEEADGLKRMDVRRKTFSITIHSPGAERLRKTVQAKLAEFMGSYTDDVLAEYVVVLVGHGKQYSQTIEDLEAFLGSNTEPFVEWLWDHLTANKHLYVSKPAVEEPQENDSNVAFPFAEAENEEGSQPGAHVKGESLEVDGHLQTSASPLKNTSAEVERDWNLRQHKEELNRGNFDEDIAGTRSRPDLAYKDDGRNHTPEGNKGRRLREEDGFGRFLSKAGGRYDSPSERRGSERVEAESVQKGERHWRSRHEPDTSRARESEMPMRSEHDHVQDGRHHNRNLETRKLAERSPPTADARRLDEGDDRSGRNQYQWVDRFYRPPASRDTDRREAPEGQSMERRNGKGAWKRIGVKNETGTHSRTLQGEKLAPGGRDSIGSRVGDVRVDEDEKMNAEEQAPIPRSVIDEEQRHRERITSHHGSEDHIEGGMREGLESLGRDRHSKLKRGRQSDSTHSKTEHDLRYGDSVPSRVTGPPVVRMNPSARLLQFAVRDAVGPASGLPSAKRLRSIVAPNADSSGMEVEGTTSEVPLHEEGADDGQPSSVWGRLGSTSITTRENGKKSVKEPLETRGEDQHGSGPDVAGRIGADDQSVLATGNVSSGEVNGSKRRSRLMGRLGRTNGYVDHGPGRTSSMVLPQIDSSVQLSEKSRGRGDYTRGSEPQQGFLFRGHVSDPEEWNGNGRMHEDEHIGQAQDAQAEETQAGLTWEGEESFRVEVPPPPRNLRSRLGPRVHEFDSQGAYGVGPVDVEDQASRLGIATGFGAAQGDNRGSSSWHRVTSGQATLTDQFGPADASLRVVMEEGETEDDEAMEENTSQEVAAEGGLALEDVDQMKRRMRQVQLEMTKLRARQAEVVNLNRTAPLPGLKVFDFPPSEEDINARSIFVSNVHFAATVAGLTAHFGACGEVVRVTILTDPTSGLPRGCAYIEFASEAAVTKALELNESSFLSRLLKVVRKPTTPAELLGAAPWRGPIRRPTAPPRAGRNSFLRGGINSFPSAATTVKGSPVGRLQWRRSDPSADAGIAAAAEVTTTEFPTVAGSRVPAMMASTTSPLARNMSWSAGAKAIPSAWGRGLTRSLSYHRSLETSSTSSGQAG